MLLHIIVVFLISDFSLLRFLIAGKPSRVIHLRNIPSESGEADVIQLGVPFGRVTNVLVLKGKNQAFLEMADEVSATAMVACFNNNPPQVRGRIVYVQFSNHRELKTDQSHSIVVSTKNWFCVFKNVCSGNFVVPSHEYQTLNLFQNRNINYLSFDKHPFK